MPEPGTVVSAILLGQPKPCTECDGETQAARVTISTSKPDHNGFGWARHCPQCNSQSPLNATEMQVAKDAYSASQRAPVGGWTAAGH